jgi:hypothetical protein
VVSHQCYQSYLRTLPHPTRGLVMVRRQWQLRSPVCLLVRSPVCLLVCSPGVGTLLRAARIHTVVAIFKPIADSPTLLSANVTCEWGLTATQNLAEIPTTLQEAHLYLKLMLGVEFELKLGVEFELKLGVEFELKLGVEFELKHGVEFELKLGVEFERHGNQQPGTDL